MFATSHPSTAGSVKAPGGSIDARSTGCRVASTSARSSCSAIAGSFPLQASPRHDRRLFDLVVNRMIPCCAMAGPSIDPAAAELQERARRFTDEVLIPLEPEAEVADGRLPEEAIERVKREAL